MAGPMAETPQSSKTSPCYGLSPRGATTIISRSVPTRVSRCWPSPSTQRPSIATCAGWSRSWYTARMPARPRPWTHKSNTTAHAWPPGRKIDMETHSLIELLIYLGSAVLIVPIAVRLGLGPVLGFLLAGCVIGPWGLKLVTDVQGVLEFENGR